MIGGYLGRRPTSSVPLARLDLGYHHGVGSKIGFSMVIKMVLNSLWY